MLNPIDFFKTELTQVLEADATSLTLPDALATALCAAMQVGTSIPLVISYPGGGFEVVTVDSAVDKVFTITRGANGTTAARWPVGACVQSGWTTSLLDEYICQLVDPKIDADIAAFLASTELSDLITTIVQANLPVEPEPEPTKLLTKH